MAILTGHARGGWMMLVGGERARSFFAFFTLVAAARARNPARSRKPTWAEKITDDLNSWLQARRLEVEGDLRGAADAYARDKEIELDRGNDARAGLSAACEARCLQRLGLDAVPGFGSAARLYVSAAWVELRANPRGAMQLFERARECYELSNSMTASREVAMVSEAIRRALDFGGRDRLSFEQLEAKHEVDPIRSRGQSAGATAPLFPQPLP